MEFTVYTITLFCFFCCFLYKEESHEQLIETTVPVSSQSGSNQSSSDNSTDLPDSTSIVLAINAESPEHADGPSRTYESTTLATLSIRQLKKLASVRHIKGYSNLTKAQLIETLLK